MFSAYWASDLVIHIPYIANDSLYDNPSVNRFSMYIAIDYYDTIDYTDTTWHGYYIKIWARKMSNWDAIPVPESCYIDNETSFSDTFYGAFHTFNPAYFTLQSPWQSYMSLTLPVQNLKEIDGLSPFYFDKNDSLWIYIEDRYGYYTGDYWHWDSCYWSCQKLKLFVVYESDSEMIGTKIYSGPLSDSCWGVRPFLLSYYPEWINLEDLPMEIRDFKKPTEHYTLTAFPNPFNSSCIITAPAGAELEIYDLRGNVVYKPPICSASVANLSPLIKGDRPNAQHEGQGVYIWTPAQTIASGIYFVKARTEDGETAERKVVLVR